MSNTPTPHISARNGDFAKTVLLPGDPLRAKFIAEKYLTDCALVTDTRNMLGFTGYFEGKRVSVMGAGMGMPSMGIYSYELFSFYDVENIIRIGSAGAMQDDIKVKDIILALGACTDSNYAAQYKLSGTFAPIADYGLLSLAEKIAAEKGVKYTVGNVLSSDMFYNADTSAKDRWKDMGVKAVEMEAAALYMNAAYLKKKALCILTVSDHIYTGESLAAKERETGFSQMAEIALKLANNI